MISQMLSDIQANIFRVSNGDLNDLLRGTSIILCQLRCRIKGNSFRIISLSDMIGTVDKILHTTCSPQLNSQYFIFKEEELQEELILYFKDTFPMMTEGQREVG